MLGLSIGMIAIGWIMFGLGVFWGVHGSVVSFSFQPFPQVGSGIDSSFFLEKVAGTTGE